MIFDIYFYTAFIFVLFVSFLIWKRLYNVICNVYMIKNEEEEEGDIDIIIDRLNKKYKEML